jgi:RNA polymerase sigma factor (TIGR02999 family)
METHEDVTTLLGLAREGNSGAAEQLCHLIYDELRALAEQRLRHEPPGHTLQPTALVNEVFLRLLSSRVLEQAPSRNYLFGAASTAMRRVLVDHARRKKARAHGGDWQRTPLDEVLDTYTRDNIDILALDEALERLQELHPRQRQVVDEYHFGGFTLSEIAEHLGVSEATVCTDFKRARLWLAAQLSRK